MAAAAAAGTYSFGRLGSGQTPLSVPSSAAWASDRPIRKFCLSADNFGRLSAFTDYRPIYQYVADKGIFGRL